VDTLDLPRPFRSAVPLAVLALVAAALDLDPRLPWLAGVFAASCFAVAAAVRATRARVEVAHVRRAADRLIVHERVLRDLDRAKLPSASPLRRPAARASEPQLRALADRLGQSRPVAPRGVLLVRSLLREGGSPLYAEDAELLLPRALARVLGALEP
jgi:hypothetical protein